MVDAGDVLGRRFGFGKRRQQHAGQNGDDGDDNEQFDEREFFHFDPSFLDGLCFVHSDVYHNNIIVEKSEINNG